MGDACRHCTGRATHRVTRDWSVYRKKNFFFKAILERDIIPSVTHLTRLILRSDIIASLIGRRSRSLKKKFPKFDCAATGMSFYAGDATLCAASHASDFYDKLLNDTTRLMLDCYLRGYNQTSNLLVRYKRRLTFCNFY